MKNNLDIKKLLSRLSPGKIIEKETDESILRNALISKILINMKLDILDFLYDSTGTNNRQCIWESVDYLSILNFQLVVIKSIVHFNFNPSSLCRSWSFSLSHEKKWSTFPLMNNAKINWIWSRICIEKVVRYLRIIEFKFKI